MLSIQAVRGLSRLRANGMFLALSVSPGVPCKQGSVAGPDHAVAAGKE